MRALVQLAAALTLSAAASVAQAQADCPRCELTLNVTNAVVAAPANKTVSADDVKAAIIRACTVLGWQVADRGPGVLMATLVLRTHTAVVEIPYSATSFSILYKSSINLNEGPAENQLHAGQVRKNGLDAGPMPSTNTTMEAGARQIHRNYNGWIRNLKNGINAQLLMP